MKNLPLALSLLIVWHSLEAQTNIKISAAHLVALPNSYDSDTHQYNPDYVNPKGYLLIINIPSLVLPEKPKGWEPPDYNTPGGRIKPVKNSELSEEIKRYNAAEKYLNSINTLSIVTRLKGGTFLNRINKGVSPQYRGQESFRVPATGTYEINCVILFKNGKQTITNRSFTIKDFLVVAMGDSYASGEGNPDKKATPSTKVKTQCKATTIEIQKGNWGSAADFMVSLASGGVWLWGTIKDALGSGSYQGPAVWQEIKAHRSMKNGSALAVNSLRSSSENHTNLIRYISVARSGAKIYAGLISPNLENQRDAWINIGQVEEAKRIVGNTRIDALILSISGNDVNFSGNVKNLTTDNEGESREEIRSKVRADIAALDIKFTLLNSILPALNINKVYITEYPVRLYEKSDKNGQPYDGGECGIFSSPGPGKNNVLDKFDGILFKELGWELNKKIESVAQKNGWVYVDGIDNDFAGHGYCEDKSNTFYIYAEESCLCQSDFDGMCHPNEKGHNVYAKHILRKLQANTLFNGVQPVLPVKVEIVSDQPVKNE